MSCYSRKYSRLKLLTFAVIAFAFSSCLKNDGFPRVENINRGAKWTLKIGSTPQQVYSQLQQLGLEKKFSDVAVVYRKPFSKPEEILSFLDFYDALTLQNRVGVTDRALFQFRASKIRSIETGSAHLSGLNQWPQSLSGNEAIHVGDPLDIFYKKLQAIYQSGSYKDYQLILPDKPLELPFDPDMVNYKEWAFEFSYNVKPGRGGTSSVRLYFDNGKLKNIKHEYQEADIIYN